MTIYKGIEIDESLANIIRYMQGVEDYREVLGKLQGAWDILTLLGQLTGAAAEMSGTRESFQRLTGDLLNQLGKETRRKAVADLRSKAQVSIDILVRNLFERTADIGFLSADDDVRDYLLGSGCPRSVLETRFREYVQKYSVYSDIVLFDLNGQITARLAAHPASASQHPLLDQSKSTSVAYVEFFGEADFLPPGNHLVYAFRTEDHLGHPIGVLALVFRLEDEMQGVFANLLTAQDSTVLATITQDGQVVATSSPIQLPVGSRLSRGLITASGEVIRFAGREYLAIACPAHGYQGYGGPGWIGLGLVPVEFAFERNDMALLGHLDAAVLAEVTRHPNLFSEDLRTIPKQAERIQDDLNRSVWNGSVRQVDSANQVGQSNASFAKTLLWEISNTGRKTQAVFEQSIGNLHQTVVAALLQSGESRAALAIDVMDRNLYERANDCRWWALNATFRRALASGVVSSEDTQRCSQILAYINGLYTVYDNLILFDAHGTVIAVSKPERAALVGNRLHEEWVERCLGLNTSQGYVVSHFVPTSLYANRPAYVYAAAVQHPDNNRVVGGIGIVFDTEPQLAAMLNDALPRDNTGTPIIDSFTLFTQRDGMVLSSCTTKFPVASHFPLEPALRSLDKGSRMSSIVTLNDEYFALGAVMSAGYREYKTCDGHRDDILALCAYPLGKASAPAHQLPNRKAAVTQGQSRSRRVGVGGSLVEIATFYIGQQWLGIPATDVVEAIDSSGITPALGGSNPLVAGVKMYRGNLITILHLKRLMGLEETGIQGRQIVVVRTHQKVCLGLLVDELGEIPEVSTDEIMPMGNVNGSQQVLNVGVVHGLADGDAMLSVLSTERLCLRAGCHCTPSSNERVLTTIQHA